MTIDTKTIVSVTEANQNFSRVARIADQHGEAIIFRNNRPKYRLVDLEGHPDFDLTDDEKIAALKTQAAGRGLELQDDAFDYLMRRAPRDMRSLMSLLVALDRYSLEHKRAITLPLLREVLLAPKTQDA